VRDSVVLLLGLAYKPGTGDIRESPVLRVFDLLAARGAVVRVVDSHVERHRCPPSMKLVELSESEVCQADAVVLLTDHEDVDYAMVEREARFVLDTRNRMSGPRVERL
jgi:UDP-N-acetyl-D-mannosaminuronic acid dehydrogenase/UDP-N-acetyl-D-glucosamine dehydrogenase